MNEDCELCGLVSRLDVAGQAGSTIIFRNDRFLVIFHPEEGITITSRAHKNLTMKDFDERRKLLQAIKMARESPILGTTIVQCDEKAKHYFYKIIPKTKK
ncbi:MAG TPA: hypothetical protein PLQ44_00125 [Candidatus Paceibacterota bacterium]|jgi:hypothetical protein|nr:hypothetical protein [Candidatus Paceibacterota bacterium]HPT40010.1 hypothetical protein [Candidatus Paceibacterota bacterium]